MILRKRIERGDHHGKPRASGDDPTYITIPVENLT